MSVSKNVEEDLTLFTESVQNIIIKLLSEKREATQLTYMKELKVFKCFVNKALDKVTDKDAYNYEQLLYKKKIETAADGKYSSSTIRKKLNILNAFYKKAIVMDLVESNPFKNISLPKPENMTTECLNEAELIVLLKTAKESSVRDHLLILLPVTCRFMPIEIEHLTWNNIVIDRDGIYAAEKVFSRADSYRSIPITKLVFDLIQEYKQQIMNIEGDGFNEYSRVFRNYKNEVLSRSGFTRTLRVLSEKAFNKKKYVNLSELSHMGFILAGKSGADFNELIQQTGFKTRNSIQKYNKVYSLDKLFKYDPACNKIKLPEY